MQLSTEKISIDKGSCVTSLSVMSEPPSTSIPTGLKNVKEVMNMKVSSFLQHVQIMCQLVNVGEITTYVSGGREKKMFRSVVADSTGFVTLLVYAEHLHKTFSTSSCLMVSNFLPKPENNTIVLTSATKIFKMKSISPPVSKEILEAAKTPSKPKQVLIEDICVSPKGARVSLKGKVVKLSPNQKRTIRKTNEEVSFREVTLKDHSGKVKLSLWRNLADTSLTVGKIVTLGGATVTTFKNEKLLSSLNSTTMDHIHDSDLDMVSDEDSDEEVEYTTRTQDQAHQQANLIAFSNINMYEACSTKSCYLKKLQNKSCPTCARAHNNELYKPLVGVSADLALHLDCGLVAEGKAFRPQLATLISSARPGLTVPSTEAAVETLLMDILPIRVLYSINLKRIVTLLKPASDL